MQTLNIFTIVTTILNLCLMIATIVISIYNKSSPSMSETINIINIKNVTVNFNETKEQNDSSLWSTFEIAYFLTAFYFYYHVVFLIIISLIIVPLGLIVLYINKRIDVRELIAFCSFFLISFVFHICFYCGKPDNKWIRIFITVSILFWICLFLYFAIVELINDVLLFLSAKKPTLLQYYSNPIKDKVKLWLLIFFIQIVAIYAEFSV